jgi:maltooligosyltrehalose trehalohydrolase
MSEGRLKVAAALMLASPFVPLLFMGEEWAASTPFQYFTDHPDPELGRAVSEGRRSEFSHFGWDPEQVPDPQDESTFRRSKLDWTEPEQGFHREMLEWYRALISLRRRIPSLTDPGREATAVQCDEQGGWMRIRRGDVEILVNVGSEGAQLDADGSTLLLASDPGVRLDRGMIVLPADSVALIQD